MVESGPDRAASVENVIDEDDIFSINVVFKLGAVDDRVCTDGREVIAVERNVEDAVLRTLALESLDLVAEPLGKRYTAPADTDQI